MKTLKKVMLLILVLVSVMAIFTITVKARTTIKQANTIDEQDIENIKYTLKEPEKILNLDTKEESSKIETKSQEKKQTKEADNREEAIIEVMDPNTKVEVKQYPEEQNEQVIEEQNYNGN